MPPNWDSWGKIRVLRDGFDVEAINKAWSVDIEESIETNPDPNGAPNHEEVAQSSNASGGAVEVYEERIRDPRRDALQATATESNGYKLEVSSQDTQGFLASQLEILEKIRQGAELSGMDSSRQARGRNEVISGNDLGEEDSREARVSEHIGPVQFNMGGIQVDADDMLQRLKVCFVSFNSFNDRTDFITGSPNIPNPRARRARSQ